MAVKSGNSVAPMFTILEDVINSIRTASESVVEASAVGKATLQINNKNPGNYTFNLSDSSTSVDISVDLPSSDLSGLVTAINASGLNLSLIHI